VDPAPALSSPVPQAVASEAGRIASLDLLRGLCAIAVAAYHVLPWVGLPELHNLGLYGVYLFFLLSGASMSVAYGQRLRRGYPITRYLLLRYVRLAPLYAAVTTFSALFHRRHMYSPLGLLGHWLLNVTFLFGITNPGATSLVTGGWSLGIEFLFYLTFPLLFAVVSTRRGLAVAGALLALQLIFVNVVLGGTGTTLEAAWPRYTQLGAFIGYFAVGTWVGARRLDGGMVPLGSSLGWVGWLLLLLVLGTQSGGTAEGSLIGLRGVALAFGSCLLLVLTLRLQVPARWRSLASWLGDLSYPLYLLHPVVFTVCNHPRVLGRWHQTSPVRLAVVVLLLACAVATLVYRWFEAPILAWGKRRLAR
jgi:peptidoglycan/LPS O-acetylase OafA/YrhL